jgi:GNAT superfamily N-acetyltransferase
VAEPIIREVRPDELNAQLDLYRYLHEKDETLSPERAQDVWKQICESKNVHCIGAEVDGRVVASCMLTITPNLTRGGRAYGLVENVVTHPDFRRRGIGRTLLHGALDIAWKENCYKVMLLTGRKTEQVHKFYQSAGFVWGLKVGYVARRPEAR